ncbi:hypothetical protein MXB_2610 [Myxobolus squamalis]|nr:hypothetical protein MXB_2610 [Myxobolus squamalis]
MRKCRILKLSIFIILPIIIYLYSKKDYKQEIFTKNQCGNDKNVLLDKIKNAHLYSYHIPNYCKINRQQSLENSTREIKILFLLIIDGTRFLQVMRLLNILYDTKHFYLIHVDNV